VLAAQAQNPSPTAPVGQSSKRNSERQFGDSTAEGRPVGRRPALDGSPERAYHCRMLQEAMRKLQGEVEDLNHELTVTIPAALKKAIQNGDLRENGDYHAALERQHFVKVRLSQLRGRLAKLSQIDLTKVPQGRVGLGSRVTVKDRGTGEVEELELVIPEAMDFDLGHISVSSPLGRGLVDRGVGDVAVVQLPAGVRELEVLGLRTLHDQLSDAQGGPAA
jgi:transcription elongation factor GreA